MIIQETTKMSEREKMAARNSNFCYLLNALYPVGSIYVSKDPTDPAELFGGSWKRIKERFIWAIGDNENPGDTGGEKTHTLTEAELPELSGSIYNFALQSNDVSVGTSGVFSTRSGAQWATYGTNGDTTNSDIVDFSAGSEQAHNNMPPWEGFYIWERIESDVPMGGSAGMLLADQTYHPESANAQSGIAVAQAVDTCSPAIVITSDTAKALTVNDSSESVIKGLTAYGESTQDGTPTPDSPVEIVSVENPVISVYGKNLFDKDTMIISGAYVSGTGQYQTSASSEKTAIIPVPKNSTVTFSKIVTSILRVGLCTVYPTSGTQLVSFQDVSNKKSFTAATGNNSFLVAFFYNNSGETVNYEEAINSIQLEIGSTVTNYEPYTVQTATVPHTFRGLKNSNAGWFVRDEVVVDVKSQTVKIIKRLLERVIDGTENWNDSTSGSKYLITGDKAKGTGNVISNRFKRGYDEGRVPGEISSAVTNSAVFVMYTEDITVSDFKSMLAEWYASGNPMVMVYVLETPTETDITATEAGQVLLALTTNYPTTSVISDIDLNLTYRADTKNYIDNKIAALTALTLEG